MIFNVEINIFLSKNFAMFIIVSVYNNNNFKQMVITVLVGHYV